MSILQDGIYTDAVLAVVREYATNAWDIHRQAGQPKRPIKVTMPTALNPTFKVRDWGTGLSLQEIIQVFTQYGASTKRKTNLAAGCLGLGCKSGFAYTEQFTVTSWYKGVKSIYTARKGDDSDERIRQDNMALLHSEPCPEDETGIEIEVPVKPDDIHRFGEAGRRLFPYFDPLPDVNLTLPEPPRDRTKFGWVSERDAYDDHPWIAVMGCVPYRLDLDQIEKDLEDAGLWESLSQLSGGIVFEIGAVDMAVSREELKYTRKTKQALVKQFHKLLDAYTEAVMDTLKSNASAWEKRLKGSFLAHTLSLDLPDRWAAWGWEKVPMWAKPREVEKDPSLLGAPDTFKLHEGTAGSTGEIIVDADTKLWIMDDPRNLRGYGLINKCDYVVLPKDGESVALLAEDGPAKDKLLKVIGQELSRYLSAAGLTGIPISRISTRHWSEPHDGRRGRGKGARGRWSGESNPKHRVQHFQLLVERRAFDSPWSQNWGIVKREPTKDDVFVVLESFQVKGRAKFYERVQRDAALAKALGAEFPPIYGYKTTAKKPVVAEGCLGTEYHAWRKKFFMEHAPEWVDRQLYEHWMWSQAFVKDYPYHHKQLVHNAQEIVTFLAKKKVGSDHPMVQFFLRHIESSRAMEAAQKKLGCLMALMKLLESEIKGKGIEGPDWHIARLKGRYPLMKTGGCLTALYSRERGLWVDYIKLVDTVKAGESVSPPDGVDATQSQGEAP